MDYLTRDSFYTGVSEGVIGYDRILKMLTVENGELMVEEKGIYSIEKFLIARRQMYWQVYLHKTVLSAEIMLVHLLKRAKMLALAGDKSLATGGAIDFFLFEFDGVVNKEMLDKFCELDDSDCTFAIKKWTHHTDFVLSSLCKRLLNRKLLKIKLQSEPFDDALIQQKSEETSLILGINEKEASYFIFTGEADNTMYNMGDDKINILFKDGSVKDITSIDNPLIHQTISAPIKKFYICSLT
jgi:HD superfamily phosphohydrolase